MSELTDELKPLFEQFVGRIGKMVKADLDEFGKGMMEHFASFLIKAYVKGNESYEADIRHLRAQAELLLVDYRVSITRDLREALIDGLEYLARIGLTLLKTSLPAL